MKRTKLMVWSCTNCKAVGMVEKTLSSEPQAAVDVFKDRLRALHDAKSPGCKSPDLQLQY